MDDFDADLKLSIIFYEMFVNKFSMIRSAMQAIFYYLFFTFQHINFKHTLIRKNCHFYTNRLQEIKQLLWLDYII